MVSDHVKISIWRQSQEERLRRSKLFIRLFRYGGTCAPKHYHRFQECSRILLQDVHIDDRDDDHDKALSIISYIGCAISLVGLVLTIITILIFK